MSGGAGTRLWPASTEDHPKQFLSLCGPRTLFENTLHRVEGAVGAISFEPPLVLGSCRHASMIESCLARANISATAIVLEPAPRNTAAAAVAAAAVAHELRPDALVLLIPADHMITNVSAFHAAIEQAAPFARERIVTFGIQPSKAVIEYGYIRAGALLGAGIREIRSFHEKPSAETASSYLAAGDYYWNSGMFLFSPQLLLREFDASADIRDHTLEALAHAKRVGSRIELSAAHFAAAPSAPLDIAVMEKTSCGAVLPCDFGWADIGSWDEVWRLSQRDASGNAIQGAVVLREATDNLVIADGMKVCVAGVDNLIVIATPDSVLILPRDRAQEVKSLREIALKRSQEN